MFNKKTGIYVVLVVLLLLAMFVLKNKLRIVLPIVLTSVVSFAVLPLLVFPILNVSPGSKVEVLGFFYQQTAQYVIDYPEDISSEEYKIIDSLIGIETLEDRFDPHNIDDIKGWGFDPNVEYWPSNSELIEYIKVYLAQGLRHPDSYIKAVLSLCSGWFNLSSENAVLEKLDYQHLQLEPSDGSLHIERDGRIQAISEKASSALIWMSSIPGLNLLFCQSLWASFLPILLSAFIVKYRRKNWLVILPTVVTFCFLMLCPVSQPTHPETFRYALPLIFTVPLLFGLLMSKAFGVENSEIES